MKLSSLRKLLGDLKSFPQISEHPGEQAAEFCGTLAYHIPEMPDLASRNAFLDRHAQLPWIILMQIHCSLLEPVTFKLEGFVIKSSQFERILQEC